MATSIGKVLESIPSFFKCKDGAFSTHNGRGACNFHGGLSSAKPIKLRRRCKTIPVQTPTKQADLFRKENQGNLFSQAKQTALKIGDFYKHKTRQEYAQVRDIHKNLELCIFTTVSMISKRKEGTFEVIEHSPCNTAIISNQELLKNWTKIDPSGVPQPTLKLIKEAATRRPSATTTQAQAPKEAQMTPSVFDIPINEIFVNPEWFQNRKGAFSLRSVENILQAIKDNSFRWSQLDPVILWLNPKDNRLYVLSGHSRLEAFTRAASQGLTIDGRGFSSIPAKIEKGISLDQARQIALNSNTLSTKETDIERATYYANMRLNENASKKSIEDAARRNEGSNAARVLAYSYLNPSGKTLNALQLLDTAQETSNQTIKIIAKWIGEARRRFTGLTDSHENELYDFLVTAKNYGTSKGQIKSELEFLQKVQNVIMKRTEFGVFDSSKPLNLQSLIQKSPTEQTYDSQLRELQSNILELEKQIKNKQEDLARRGASEAQILKVTEGDVATLARRRKQYVEMMQAKGRIMEQASKEISLFAIGRIIDARGALYLCKDGTFSTHNGRGACMRHDGLKTGLAVFANRKCFQPKRTGQTTQIDLFRKETQGDLFNQGAQNLVKVNTWYKVNENNWHLYVTAISEDLVWAYIHKYIGGNLKKNFSESHITLKRFNDKIKNGEWVETGIPSEIDPNFILEKKQRAKRTVKPEVSPEVIYPSVMPEVKAEDIAPEVTPIDENLQRRIEAYETKKQGRIERFRDIAAKRRDESNDAYKQSKRMYDVIPFGQPILIDHYSAKRDINYRNRAWNLMGKSVELDKKADYYENKAENAESNRAISSDDPLAVQKLKEKLQTLRNNQEYYKAVNAAVRKNSLAMFLAIKPSHTEEKFIEISKPDFAGRKGFPAYVLQNNNQNIKTVEDRIKHLEKLNALEHKEVEYTEGVTIVQDPDINRLMIKFDHIPNADVRTDLKRAGFKWSPTNKAWQRQISNNATWQAKDVLKKHYGKDKVNGLKNRVTNQYAKTATTNIIGCYLMY